MVELLSEEIVTISETCSTFSPANTLAWSYIMLITSSWGIMNTQWRLDSATVERNSSMCGVTSHDLQWGKKGRFPLREVVLFGGGGWGENFGKYAFPFATGSCRKFKSEVLIKWKAPKTNKLEDLSRELFLHCDSVITAVTVPTTVFFLSSLEREQLASSIR